MRWLNLIVLGWMVVIPGAQPRERAHRLRPTAEVPAVVTAQTGLPPFSAVSEGRATNQSNKLRIP
jgi:hypothetical protein